MRWASKLRRAVGTLWAAPWSGVAFATTLAPLWASRQISFHSFDRRHATVRFVAKRGTPLSQVYTGHYWGVTLGSFQLYSDWRAVDRLDDHENVHTRQAWALGPFFPLLYAGAHLVLLVDKMDWREAYEANPFEEHARSHSK